MNKILYYICLFIFIHFFACSSKDVTDEEVDSSNSKEIDTVVFSLNHPKITYTTIKLNSNKQINEIINKYQNDTILGPAYRKALRTLNRKELRFIRAGETIVVPDSIINDIRAYSIFPDEYKAAKKIAKIIIIDNEYQCYGCYEYGILVRFAAANTGKERTPTFPGRYSLVWKQKLRLSSLDSTWKMPYTFNFHQYAGNAMHQFAMPGRPVSHSCIRQFEDDAKWIFNWGDKAKYDSNSKAIPNSGTPLIILNMFDYTRKTGGPWLELTSNKDYYIKLPDKPLEVEEALIPYSQIPKSSRGVLPKRERYLYAEDTLRARGIIRADLELTPTIDFNKIRRDKAKKKYEDSVAKSKVKELQNTDTIRM